MEPYIKGILSHDIPVEIKMALIEEELTSGRPRRDSDCTAVVLLAIRLIKFGTPGECSVGWRIIKLFRQKHRERLQTVLTIEVLLAMFQRPRSLNDSQIACLLNLLDIFLEVSDMADAGAEIEKSLMKYLNETNITKSDLDLILDFFNKYPFCVPTGISMDPFTEVLVKAIAAFSMPEKSDLIADYSDEMKSFIEKLVDCLCPGKDKRVLIYLLVKNVFLRISNSDVCPNPSPALAFILQLVPTNLIPCSISKILMECESNESRSRLLCVLCDWLIWSPKATRVPEWIIGFLFFFATMNHYGIIYDVAYQSLSRLFGMLIIPVMRDSVLPVVIGLLIATRTIPDIFSLVVPKVPFLIHHLNLEKTPGSRKTLESIVDTVKMLIAQHPSELYVKINMAIESVDHASEPSTSSSSRSTSPTTKKVTDTERCSTTRSNRVGLVNLNNTCYMNAILQALVMTKRFSDAILNKEELLNSPALEALQVLFALLLHSERPSISPDTLLGLTRPSHFQTGRQQDSYEYMMALFDVIEREEKDIRNAGSFEEMPHPIDLRTTIASCSSMEVACPKTITSSEPSLMIQPNEEPSTSVQEDPVTNTHEIFLGKQCTTFMCVRCESRSTHKDVFTDLQLCFPDNIMEKPVSIQDLLDLYLQPEDLKGDNLYECSNCKGLQEGLKYIEISSSPSHLILILKVFGYDSITGTRKKLFPKVHCSQTIQIRASDNNNVIEEYRLYAIVAHKGVSIDAGHYVTFAQDECGVWSIFNDHSVRTTSFEEEINNCGSHTPYMLFYQKNTEKLQVGVQRASIASLKPHLRELIRMENLRYRSESQPKRKSSKRVLPKDRDDFDPPSSCGGGMGLGHISNRCVF